MIESKMVVEAEANNAQVRRILQSKAFRTSEVHRNLLNYLAEKSLSGEADSLKEYTVGLDVFAKPASYDPRQESVVRMHMARLRQKLAEYYRTEGVADPIIVEVPKGGFKVSFEPKPVVPEPEPSTIHVHHPLPPPSYRIEIILAGLLILAIAIASYFGLRLREYQKTASVSVTPAAWTPELRELWDPLLATDRPLVVCLATENGKDTKTSFSLTGLATANGAFLLGQFLADHKQNVYLTGSDALSMPELSMGNVVYLGETKGSSRLQGLPANVELTSEPDGVRNLHPQSGEPAFFSDSATAKQGTSESYALITHSPGLNNGKGDVLYLSGSHISSVTAGVEAFTDAALAKTLVSKMRRPDGKLPRYYQILLKVKSMDDTPIEITYVLHRELPGRAGH